MRSSRFHALTARVVFLLLSALAGCSGGGSGSLPPASADFQAADFSGDVPGLYQVKAAKVGEGTHCYVYLEKGAALSEDRITAIVQEFDNIVYPAATVAFGPEPNPGIDSDPKTYILLLDIKDGYNGTSKPSYVAGYFDPANQYPRSVAPYSNEKELIYLDIYPADPGTAKFYGTLAHEFQHMIHWEQKEHRRDISDDTWLNEAMSEIAPVYCGYGPSYGRVLTFENAPADSLTAWNGTVNDYGVVYMWAQYFKDRFEGMEPNVFRRMLENKHSGINAVSTALGQIDPALTFERTFRDWTIANYSGNAVVWPGYPEWSYRSIDTRAGKYGGVTLPGLFPAGKQNPASPLAPLSMWSADYYSYSASEDGTLTWTAAHDSDRAVLIDPEAETHTELVSDASYTLSRKNFLILSNPAGSNARTGASVTVTSLFSAEKMFIPAESRDDPEGKNPRAMLDEAGMHHGVQERAKRSGEGEPVCVHGFFQRKEKSFRLHGARPHY